MSVASTRRFAAKIAEAEMSMKRVGRMLALLHETFGPIPPRADPFGSRRVATRRVRLRRR